MRVYSRGWIFFLLALNILMFSSSLLHDVWDWTLLGRIGKYFYKPDIVEQFDFFIMLHVLMKLPYTESDH